MRKSGKVRVGGVMFLPDYVRERGGAPERVLQAAKVVPIELGSADGWIDFERMAALYEAAAEELDDDLFGWRFTRILPLSSFGLLSYAVLNAADVQTGVGNLARYATELSISVEATSLRIDAGVAEVGFRVDPRWVEAGRQLVEGHLSAVLMALKKMVGTPWVPRRVRLQCREGGRRQSIEAQVGVEVEFDSDLNSVIFDAALLDRAVAGADRDLLPLIERRLSELPSVQSEAFASRVGDEVARILCDGPPSIEKVARQLAMSPRSLQRRLSEEDITFRQLVNRVRLELADEYLEDPKISVTEISMLLGYHGVSSFTQAFRAARGVPPITWRRKRVGKTEGQ